MFCRLCVFKVKVKRVFVLICNQIILPLDDYRCSLFTFDLEKMWKAAAGTNAKLPTVKTVVNHQNDEDEWETDPDYINNVTEEEQRWGGGRTAGAIEYVYLNVSSHSVLTIFFFLGYSMNALREQTAKEDSEIKKKLMSQAPQASYGYGGKFGVQQDR